MCAAFFSKWGLEAGNSKLNIPLESKLAGDKAEMEAKHEQRKKYERERNPDGQRAYRSFPTPLVLDQKVERGEEARDDEDREQYDENFHVPG